MRRSCTSTGVNDVLSRCQLKINSMKWKLTWQTDLRLIHLERSSKVCDAQNANKYNSQSQYQLQKPSLEVAPTTLLLIYIFQFMSAFQPNLLLSRLVTCMHSRKCFAHVNSPVTDRFAAIWVWLWPLNLNLTVPKSLSKVNSLEAIVRMPGPQSGR